MAIYRWIYEPRYQSANKLLQNHAFFRLTLLFAAIEALPTLNENYSENESNSKIFSVSNNSIDFDALYVWLTNKLRKLSCFSYAKMS